MKGVVDFLFLLLLLPLARAFFLAFCSVLLLLRLASRPLRGQASAGMLVKGSWEVLRRSIIPLKDHTSPSLSGHLLESADFVLDIEYVLDRGVDLVGKHIVQFHEVYHLQDLPLHVRPL